MSKNPFRQPRPRQGIVLKQRVWNANEQGKDASQGTLKLYANDEYLWIGSVASVPLAWMEAVEPLGPGFRLVWLNELTGQMEATNFCIRTFFGYNKARRDALIEDVLRLARAARGESADAERVPEENPVCDKCGAPVDWQSDLVGRTNFLVYLIERTDRRLLCADHARSAQRRMAVRNAITATFGFPGFVTTPVLNWEQTDRLSVSERVLLTAVTAVPFAVALFLAVSGLLDAL